MASDNPDLAVADDHRAMNRIHGAMLADRRYPVTLMLGCADGTDLIGLGIETDKVIAIEPAREWWRDAIGGIPAEYRAPATDGSGSANKDCSSRTGVNKRRAGAYSTPIVAASCERGASSTVSPRLWEQ